MNIVIVGMGIIGGSYAKAIKKYTSHKVIGINRSTESLNKALKDGAIDEIGNENSLKTADLTILCIYPNAAIDYIKKYGKYIKENSIVTDTSGIKIDICKKMSSLSEKYNFHFVGSHPMAGKETYGYSSSEADLFKGASCIITPCNKKTNKKAIETIANLSKSIMFKNIKYSTPEEHDRMISFTSQVPHVLACAYVMSDNTMNHKGFSAGSYRDVSRVANINAQLWSELFIENKEPLINEINTLTDNINKIKNAIEKEDKEELEKLLDKSRKIKEALGE